MLMSICTISGAFGVALGNATQMRVRWGWIRVAIFRNVMRMVSKVSLRQRDFSAFRLDPSRNRATDGAGLWLTIAQMNLRPVMGDSCWRMRPRVAPASSSHCPRFPLLMSEPGVRFHRIPLKKSALLAL